MKKVVCAQCGLVNLDKFVSFPHCAACGALLPREARPKWRRFLRRPVRPLYWMLAVGSGLALLGLAVASIERETRTVNNKPLAVYSQLPRVIAPGQTINARFTLDSAQENPDDEFKSVSLRLSRATQNNFVLVLVQPAPTTIETRGRGLYYLWEELPRNTTLKLDFKPRVSKKVAQLQVTLWAANYRHFEVRSSVEIRAPQMQLPRIQAPLAPMQTPSKVAK